MTLPTIHLNGTSRQRLMEDQFDAHVALMEALAKMAAAAPNGRDYYVRPGSFELAMQEHEARMAKVREVVKELEAWCEGVANG